MHNSGALRRENADSRLLSKIELQNGYFGGDPQKILVDNPARLYGF